MITFDKHKNAFDDNNNMIVSAANVLSMLRPEGGWATHGDEYENIEWIACEPVTKKQFTAGFSAYESWKLQKDQEKETDKTAAESKLAALGLTIDDLKALLS